MVKIKRLCCHRNTWSSLNEIISVKIFKFYKKLIGKWKY